MKVRPKTVAHREMNNNNKEKKTNNLVKDLVLRELVNYTSSITIGLYALGVFCRVKLSSRLEYAHNSAKHLEEKYLDCH